MEEDLNDDVPCSSLAVEALIRLGTAGAVWGFCSSPYDARQQGLTGTARASFVANSVCKTGTHCGFVGVVYSITRCGVQKYRRRNDWVNSLIAGGVAGAVVATGTRSWTQVIGMAARVWFCSSRDTRRFQWNSIVPSASKCIGTCLDPKPTTLVTVHTQKNPPISQNAPPCTQK